MAISSYDQSEAKRGTNIKYGRRSRKQSRSKQTKEMDIKRTGSQPSTKGSAEYFTGMVRVDPLFQANDPARAVGVSVTFEPGSRTAWHTHPLGQTLIVIAGCGLAQRWDGAIEEIRPGDVVWFPPGEKHWHGATSSTAMTHFARNCSTARRSTGWRRSMTNNIRVGRQVK